MSYAIDREGLFRGTVKDYQVKQHPSGTVGLHFVISVDEAWNGVAWEDWRQYDLEATGEQFVIKKDGSVNTKTVESLVGAMGWDGSFISVANKTWIPRPAQFSVKADEWNGKAQFRLAYVNAWDHSKRNESHVEVDAAALDARFGSQIRALASSQTRNAAVPSRPLPPPLQIRKAEQDASVPF